MLRRKELANADDHAKIMIEAKQQLAKAKEK